LVETIVAHDSDIWLVSEKGSVTGNRWSRTDESEGGSRAESHRRRIRTSERPRAPSPDLGRPSVLTLSEPVAQRPPAPKALGTILKVFGDRLLQFLSGLVQLIEGLGLDVVAVRGHVELRLEARNR